MFHVLGQLVGARPNRGQKKDHLRGEGDGLQRSVGDLGFSRRRYDLTPLRWGKMLWADSGYRCR